MKKTILCFCIALISFQIGAQTTNIPSKKTQKAFAKLDFLSIDMPVTSIPNEQNMGFTGVHYNLFLNNWAYAGLGIYGAVSGERGGFFTLGVNAGFKHYFYNNFYTDIGFHFGGGGGAGAPDGGGAFILPHVNLGHDFEDFSLNMGYSFINFFDGGLIKNHQFNVALEIPLDFEYTDYKQAEKEYNLPELETTNWKGKTKRTALLLHQNNLKIRGRTQRANGTPYNGETIRLAGFELSTYFTDNIFAFVKVDGAFAGIQAGYMDVFLGAGYHYSFNRNRTNLLAKFGVGAGGGGGIDTEGGFLIYPDVSLEQKIVNDMYLAVNAGLVMSPNANIFTNSYGVGLKYYIERNGTEATTNNYTTGKLKGLEVITKHDIYFGAQRMSRSNLDLHQISLQVNLDLNKNFYVAGQTSFANFGDAGAYAEGIVGLGVRTNPFLNEKVTVFLQGLGGAAGGGGISTGEGFIIKPSAGFNFDLNEKLSLRASGGYIKAKGGTLSTSFVNLGVSYKIAFLKLNK